MSVERSGGCWQCGKEFPSDNVSRADACPGCRGDTRVCRNCLFYDPLCYNACRETGADRVIDKEKANFCDWFKPVYGGASRRSVKGQTISPLQAAEALFKPK